MGNVNLVRLSGSVANVAVDRFPDLVKFSFDAVVPRMQFSKGQDELVYGNFLCEHWVRNAVREDMPLDGDAIVLQGQLIQKRGGPTRIEVEDLRVNRRGWAGATNLVYLAGGVSRDSEIRQVGRSMKSTFSVAITRPRMDPERGEISPDTTFVSCERWLVGDPTSDDTLFKGDGVFIVGQLSSYTDDQQRVHTRVEIDSLTINKRRNPAPAAAPANYGGGSADPWATGGNGGWTPPPGEPTF